MLPTTATRICAEYVSPSSAVRDLGITIDSEVSMRSHVSRTLSGCFATLRQIRSIRRSVSDPVFTSLVVSLVIMPCLQYGNATLAGLPEHQNRRDCTVSALRCRQTIYRRSLSQHVTPLLRELHWLRSRPDSMSTSNSPSSFSVVSMDGLAPRATLLNLRHTSCRRRYTSVLYEH